MGDKSLNRHRPGQRLAAVFLILVMLLGSLVSVATSAQAGSSAAMPLADVSTLHLAVVSANDSNDVITNYGISKGDLITEFRYIINIDNTGTTEQRTPNDGCSPSSPGYPESCNWVSVAGRAPHAPVYTQGDQDDFPGGVFTIDGQIVDLPEGRYLISILADNFRIDGAHFTIPGSGEVIVEMQPYDLPTATIQAAVFEDMAPTNSGPDLPAERGLAGFRAHIADYVDEVTVDVFGNPLGAEYDPVTGEYIPGTGGVVLSQCYVVANGVDIGTVEPVDEMGRCPLAFTTDEDPLLVGDITQTIEGDPIPTGAAIEGKVIIPNVGPNRYALAVSPPNKSNWIQTTTLEGNHDWDAWVMEGATGLDTEFVVAGEPFPAAFFGFVRPSVNNMADGGNTITGTGLAVNAYIPPVGGLIAGEGVRGAKAIDPNPIRRLFVSLSDLNASDETVFIQEFGCEIDIALDCSLPVDFEIPNVPDGSYVLGVWDEPQDFIFAVQNVNVSGGTVDVGDITLLGWWATLDGYIFYDDNGNGFRDCDENGVCEAGVPNFPVTMRMRENSAMDRGTVTVTTDNNGYYWMESLYPMTQWLIAEAYSDTLHTTGITYQANNQPTPTTVLGAGVDVNVLPIISQGGRLDWGVQAYAPGENGGIVGTVSYDTTRNELDPSYAALEDWQPSISDLNVELYAPVACGTHASAPCDATGQYELAQDGSYAFGSLLNTYLTETWERPSGCVARDLNGVALVHGVDENALPLDPDAPCLEAPMMGMQFGPIATDLGSADENFGASVDGNYGFGDGCYLADGVTPGLFDPDIQDCIIGSLQPLPSDRDYLVRVDIPDDVFGRPLYKVTREEDINVANGDSFVPQVHPSMCAGSLHIVDVEGIDAQGDPEFLENGDPNPAFDGDVYPEVIGDGTLLPAGVIVPASVPTHNATFVDMGGTIYEGQAKPLCDTKLIHLGDQRSIAPGFNLFTDVPLPGRFWGLIVDDLNWSSNPQQLVYGEKMGVPFAPVGIYDYTNRLVTTIESDYNGLFDVLLPSTDRISCPTPSGVCANMYRFVGNDPGIPGRWNANFNPLYRTISAEFEAFAGLTIPADLAPTQVGVTVQLPGAQTLTPVMCMLDDTQPQLLAVSKPYADLSGGAVNFAIDGFGFGAGGDVFLDDVALTTTSWSDGHIDVTLNPGDVINGTHQLSVRNSGSELTTVNGLTYHVFGSALGSITPYPANGVLDTFTNRTELGSNWGSNGSGLVVIDGPGTDNDYLRIRTGNSANISNAWWVADSFGSSQEAYFTFRKVSGRPDANQQGLLLKYSGGANPNTNVARWIEVALDNNGGTDQEDMTLRITTKSGVGPSGQQYTELLNFESPQAVFSNGDTLGARALDDGTIIVYKNGSEIVRVDSNTGAWIGYIGVRFQGTGTKSTVEASIDDFGGGDIEATNEGGTPTIITVGPQGEVDPDGLPYNFNTIQSAIDAAASQDPYVDTLVVVYPGAIDPTNPRYNGRGAYYENIIMYAPIQLQGVGPGGVRPDNSIVQGSIIDGLAFGGDTTLALNWLGKVSTLSWDGNQNINDGQVIYVLASENGTSTIDRAGSFASTDFKAIIDGFDIRGGDQQGLPGNLPEIFGTPPDAPGPVQVETQGGAIFANSYVQNLQVTNNVMESNGGSYGAIRIGTPNIGDQHNDNLRIANNRILANGGTNLAGAIGLFNGAHGYEVAYNDLCGNFSAEYGGGISHFGQSNGGSIHDNRIYFNRSYDEGAGILIAGELATNPNAVYGAPGGPQGSGPVDIFNNQIQANLAADDGGGIRFLMVGDFEMNVYNNMIVNNISTHEGGGVALDDASNVRFYNNTVMNNKTTATAITSNGLPAPAGLSTGLNSAALQATLDGGIALCGVGSHAPCFSNPLLYNNIFFNNWAGTNAGGVVTGISDTGGDTPNPWDMGSLDPGILLSPTYSVIETSAGINPDASNISTDPGVSATHDIPLTFTNWGAFVTNIMVTADLPPTLMGNYHLVLGSPAIDYVGIITAPSFDYDNQNRPYNTLYDVGADEYLP